MRVQRLICLGQIIKNEAYQSFFCHCHLDRYRVACPLIAGRFRAGDSLEFFVLALMKREYDARQEKARQRRWKRAHFPLHKSELKEARDGCQLRRLEKGIAANDLLLIDEISYARFNQEESEQLFKVISERSEREARSSRRISCFPTGRRCCKRYACGGIGRLSDCPFTCTQHEWRILPLVERAETSA